MSSGWNRLGHWIPSVQAPTAYNPNPTGVEIMVVDDFQKEISGYLVKSPTSHGEETSFLADQNSTSPNTEVLNVEFADFGSFPEYINALATSGAPPEVLSLSLGLDPGTLLSFRAVNRENEFKSKYGAPSGWKPEVWTQYRQELQDLATEAINDFNRQCSGVAERLLPAFQNLVNAGCNIVLAAGNAREAESVFARAGMTLPDNFFNGTCLPNMPEGVVIVGASNNAQVTPDAPNAAFFTSPTSQVDVGADGTQLLINTSGEYGDGTSYSAPMVAGLIADMRALNPSLTPADIERALKLSASAVTPDEQKYLGAGIVNREKALNLVRPAVAG